MAGQLWSTNKGFMASVVLSEVLRNAVQPISRFTQFADIEIALGKGKGEKYTWNVYGDTATAGSISGLAEEDKMPETSFPVSQGTVTLKEFGNSVPFTKLYDDLSEHPVRQIINKTLRLDAAKTLDRVAHAQFNKTILRATSTSATAMALTDTGTAGGSHTDVLGIAHVKLIADTMEERNIPVYDGENYMAIMRPTTMRPMLSELEGIHKYTPEGWQRIVHGEKGLYEGIRFVSQTNIPSEGKAKSDGAFFFGADTVTEVIACPLELRGKIPDDYGRSEGLAWYAIENMGITHADKTDSKTKAQARIIKWDSVN